MEETILPNPLAPNKVVRQLEELVQILRQQITILEAKNTTLTNQNQLLMLREQHCICYNQQASTGQEVSNNGETNHSQIEGSSIVGSDASTQVMSQSFDNISNLGRHCVEYLASVQRSDTPQDIDSEETEEFKGGESGSLSLGTIQIMPSEDDDDCWTTAQSSGWPFSTEMGNYEIVLVSQGPADSGITETVVSLNPEMENEEVAVMNTDEQPRSEEVPLERAPGQRGRMAAKLTCSCPICGKALSGKRSLRQHIPIHTGQRNHTCQICQMTFITKSNLTRHIRKHTGEKPYECKFCGRAFAHLGDVHMHHRTHTGERPFPCTLCENSFVTAAHLRRHLKSHERKPEGWQGNDRPGTGEDQALLCQLCGKVFIRKALLNRHLLSHERRETAAGKGKSENSTDQNSEGESSGPEFFTCTTCFKKFPTQLRLKRHESIHKKKTSKKFQCPKCKCSFSREVTLEKHLIAHAEKNRRLPSERKFTCGHCFKDYSLRIQLNQHMKQHEELEKYTCIICSDIFTQKMDYLNHMGSVHGDLEEIEGQEDLAESDFNLIENGDDSSTQEPSVEIETPFEFTLETIDGTGVSNADEALVASALRKCEVRLTRVDWIPG